MIVEIWKDIEEFEGRYQVSTLGRVKSMPKIWISGNRGTLRSKGETIIKLSIDGGGYCQADLSINNKSKKHSVHRLVAKAFLPNPENKRCVNHINSDRADNRIENIEWATHSENTKHAVKSGTHYKGVGENHNCAKLTEKDVLAIRKLKGKLTQQEISSRFNIGRRTIGKILNNELWTHI